MTVSKQSDSHPTNRPPQGDNLIRLDGIETSAHQSIPSTFHEYERSRNEPEFLQTFTVLHSLYQYRHPEMLQRLSACGSNASFFYDENTGKIVVRANHCHIRWCPSCAEKRSSQITGKVFDWLSAIEHPAFITLTLSHRLGETITDGIRRLYQAFRHFRRLQNCKNSISGGIWFFQLTKSADGAWHNHLHIAADCEWYDKQELSDDWKTSTGDSYIVDIRRIADKAKTSKYIARYAARPCKLSQFDIETAQQIVIGFKNQRLVGKWGSARQLKFADDDKIDDASPSLIPLGSWRAMRRAIASGLYPELDDLWQSFSERTPLPQAPDVKRISDILWAFDSG